MLDEDRVDLDATRAYLSFGSNVGERETTVLHAAGLLERTSIGAVVRMSSLYETEPVGCGRMDDFINAVAEVQSLLCVEDLLKRLQALERTVGRQSGRNEPRIIDIDIITFGQQLIHTKDLRVPHARYQTRRFVLVPLQEIAPSFRCPASGRTIAEMIEALPAGQRVTRVSARRMLFR